MRKWNRRTWLKAVGGSAAGIWAGSLPPTVSAGQSERQDYPLEAKPIADRVHAVLSPHSRQFPNPENRAWNSNLAFVETGDGVLVFDTGGSQAIGTALREVIRNTTDEPIRWIVNSHVHGDHWLGNGAFARDEAAILATPKARERAEREGAEWVDRFNNMTEDAVGDPELLVPTETIAERKAQRFGSVNVELIPLGHAHSADDLALWLPDEGLLLAGDVVYIGTTPGTFDADIAHWLEIHETLLALETDRILPGHGELGDSGAIRTQRDYFQVLWDEARRGFDEGLSAHEIRPRVEDKLGDGARAWPNLDERLGESVSHAWLQAEEAFF